ncbi:hypothetical protein HK100_004478 [Physocladia obscura]|uniref:G-patch domain-containing protein n=1 Tax=Physocladia obscura TaxID=109957 RepID=A0AAD5STT4_9FUNG|nr:hypothetical protein HK100_004478 [Physocladia obscura]
MEDIDYYSEPELDPLNNELLDGEITKAASLHERIDATNVGFTMLLKMGWQINSGLGREGRQGRVDPIPFILKNDQMGVGKNEELEVMHVESTKSRKLLDGEVIATESDEQRTRREMKVERETLIKEEIKAVTRAFYCELCDKQYTKISQFDIHLSSYDHNHRKRFKDMQEMSKKGQITGQVSNLKRSVREDKEKAREERELKRLKDAAFAKQQDFGKINPGGAISIESSSFTAIQPPEQISSGLKTSGSIISGGFKPISMNISSGFKPKSESPFTSGSKQQPVMNFGKKPIGRISQDKNNQSLDASASQLSESSSTSSSVPKTEETKPISFGLRQQKAVKFSFGLKKQ